MENQLLSIKEVADLLKTKENTVRTWIRRKEIPEKLVFRVGSTVRIRLKQFNEWICGDVGL